MAPEMVLRAIKKAQQSICKYKISALGFDKRGNFIGSSFNLPRFSRLGGSAHAELRLMARYGENLKTIIICRTNNKGEILPIDPCPTCLAKATELGIKIKSIA
jgi:tRNA(Arg) A34 adenosine deaminase TadA